MNNCQNCYLYKDKKFCAECGQPSKAESVDDVKKIIEEYLTNIPIYTANQNYLKWIVTGDSPSYTTEFEEAIKKLNFVTFENIYIVEIYDIVKGKDVNVRVCGNFSEYWIKINIYTKDEWSEKYHPFLKYCDEWWKYIFFANPIRKDLRREISHGLDIWEKSDFVPMVENKFYMCFDKNIIDKVFSISKDCICNKKEISLGYCLKPYNGPIDRQYLDIVIAGLNGINIEKIYTQNENKWLSEFIENKYCDDNGRLPLKIILDNYVLLQYIEQTEEICKTIVEYNGNAIQYVQEKYCTEDLCKLAVKDCGTSLRYIKNQTDEICKLAVQKNGLTLRYVQLQTEEICKLAVQENGFALAFVKNQTKELCKLAIEKNFNAIKYIKNYENIGIRKFDLIQ
jgi:hypothetical protein